LNSANLLHSLYLLCASILIRSQTLPDKLNQAEDPSKWKVQLSEGSSSGRPQQTEGADAIKQKAQKKPHRNSDIPSGLQCGFIVYSLCNPV
jgi:hypothetical protein